MNRVDVNGCCIKYLIIREWRLNKMVIMICEIQGKWLMKKANPKTHYFLFMRMLSYCKNLRWHSLRLLMSKDRVHFVTHFQTQKHLDKKYKGKKWIFSITQTKYRCVRVRFSGGISFTFPPGGSPRWRQTMTHHRLGGAAFLAIISSSFSLFKKLPTMCRIMSNSDKCLLLNDVKKYNQKKKSQLRYLCQFALFTDFNFKN